MNDRIGIAGSGAWGTALAACLASAGHEAIVWGRNPEKQALIENSRQHPSLPGLRATKGIRFTSDARELAGLINLIIALPAQSIRQTAPSLQESGVAPENIVLAAKGLETGTLRTMPELAAEFWSDAKSSILSGPTFAAELAKGLPGAAVVAGQTAEQADRLAALFTGSALRVYASTDITGVALGGAIKNVMAIAAGAVSGAGLGSNARAAIIARGLVEMTRLATALGARPETLSGLSGLGDLVLSCTDEQSRNYSLGFALGQGEQPSGALTEGAHTVAPLLALARKHDVEMPISAAVDAVLNHNLPLNEAVVRLMSRPGRAE